MTPQTSAAREPSVLYSIKITLRKKAEYAIQKLHGVTKKFDSIDELKEAVGEACQQKVSLESFGYIEPGHGARGKQRWLTSADDLEDMYSTHKGKKEILLWCYTSDQNPKKRARSPDEDEDEAKRHSKSSRYDRFMDKMTEVEAIEELREKHIDGPYTEQQL